MKPIALVLLCIMYCTFSPATYAQSWQWATSAGGTGNDWARSVATDAAGNVYMAGYYSSATISLGTTTLTNVNSGSDDVLIAKYDAAGNLLWANSVGGTGLAGSNADDATAVATDAAGNVYVAGNFNSASITFGTTTLTNSTAGANEIFIVKYNAGGSVIWAKSAGGSGSDISSAITVSQAGSVYVTGQFSSPSITFGTATLTNASSGSADLFVAMYDTSGAVLWAKRAGGTGDDWTTSLAADAMGNVYVAGYYQSASIVFGSTTLTNAMSVYPNMLLVKYDATGNATWAKSINAGSFNQAYSVITDAGGRIYLTGTFNNSTVTFGSTTLTSSGSSDVFLARYDASGNVVWAKSAGGTGPDWGKAVAADAAGNVYLAGYFSSPSISFGTPVLTNAGSLSSDIFVARYDSTGSINWAGRAGGTSDDIVYAAAANATGGLYIAGIFSSHSIDFGTNTLTNSGTSQDIFLAKLNFNLSAPFIQRPSISVYPNPCKHFINFTAAASGTFTLRDVMGKQVAQYQATEGSNRFVIPANVPSGMYTCIFENEDGSSLSYASIVYEK